MCGGLPSDLPCERNCAPKCSEDVHSIELPLDPAQAGPQAPCPVELPLEPAKAGPQAASPAEASSSASVSEEDELVSLDKKSPSSASVADAKPSAKRRPSKIKCQNSSDVDKSRIVTPSARAGDLETVSGSARKCLETAQDLDDAMAPLSPDTALTPLTSKSHIDRWNEATETLIIFDWDDTLCPTTWIWEDPRLKWNEVAPCFSDPSVPAAPQEEGKAEAAASAASSDEITNRSSSQSTTSSRQEPTMLELLQNHVRGVIQLLRLSASLGQVTIVTLAQVDWVQTSIRNFMPELAEVLEELSIEVVYARQLLPARSIRRAQEEESDVTKVLKTKAMSRVIKKFYGTGGSSKNQERSWKNIMSIGDSAAERWALQDVILGRVQRDSNGDPKECRCKVLKLLSEPSLERLTAEIQVLQHWLATVVTHDGDIDLDFGDMMDMDEDSPCSPDSHGGFPTRRRSRSSDSITVAEFAEVSEALPK